MRLLSLLIGLLLPVSASAASVFDVYWEYANETYSVSEPPQEVIDFVIEEVRKWGENGVAIEEQDIEAALTGREDALCNNKKDSNGNDIDFAKGDPLAIGSCGKLLADIVELVDSETTAQALGDELLTIANSAELATADEPRPFLDIPSSLRGLKRVWQATGSTVLPWNPDADDAIDELNRALQSAKDEGTLDEILLRFHHGFFRDLLEDDPRFTAGDEVQSALSYVSGILGIDTDTSTVNEILTPALENENIRLWARTDDLGLLWVAPVSFYRPVILPAGEYPRLRGETLAYPFSYAGEDVPSDLMQASPLCSRTMGMFGFLCRPLPSSVEGCTDPGGDDITLVECDLGSAAKKTVALTDPSCLELNPIFKDDGTPLFDESNPGSLDPRLTPATKGTICQPETEVVYPAGILGHLCYTQACVAESLDGHSLIPGRNPVLAYESTSPYLACIRPDPALGFYGESFSPIPAAPPAYLGALHVQDFVRSYCSEHGNAPHPLSGYCRYQDNIRAAEPLQGQTTHFLRVESETEALELAQKRIDTLATTLGLRHATDQSVLLRPKVLAPLAAFIQHTANLFLELERAPLTRTACPWTGPFPTSPS